MNASTKIEYFSSHPGEWIAEMRVTPKTTVSLRVYASQHMIDMEAHVKGELKQSAHVMPVERLVGPITAGYGSSGVPPEGIIWRQVGSLNRLIDSVSHNLELMYQEYLRCQLEE